MIRSIMTTAVLALALSACAQLDANRQAGQARAPQPAYVPGPSQAPLLSGATVTGDTIREDD